MSRFTMVVAVFAFSTATAGEMPVGKPYIAVETPFAMIQDAHMEARTWAQCAAAYETAALIQSDVLESPAQAQQMRNLGNGAKVAIAMSLVTASLGEMDFDNSDTSKAIGRRFDATWNYAKIAMDQWTDAELTAMAADAERLKKLNDGGIQFAANIFKTVEICLQNVETQQGYIDTWRELVMSGLLTVPDQ